jgi:hypothetical protein
VSAPALLLNEHIFSLVLHVLKPEHSVTGSGGGGGGGGSGGKKNYVQI